jgi:hypothetical protein
MLPIRLPGFFNKVISNQLISTSPSRSAAHGSSFSYRSQTQPDFTLGEASLLKAMLYLHESDIHLVDCNMVSHPYSVYIWKTPHPSHDIGRRDEPVQCYTEQWAVYVAGFMHKACHSVIKMVGFGLNIACFPNEHLVEMVERQITRQRVQE